MKWHKNFLIFSLAALAVAQLVIAPVSEGASRPRNRGLLMEVESHVSGDKAWTILDGPHVMIPKGTNPHPLLPVGGYSVTISGVVRVPIRSDYRFSLTSGTAATFVLEGKSLIETSEENPSVETPLAQLDKGYMDFSISFSGDSSLNDGFVRLLWGDEETPLAPFTYRIIGFNADAETKAALDEQELALKGRQLYFENRCFRCHGQETGDAGSAAPEWALDAPSFEGIGSRRFAGWFARWVSDPASIRPNARMPHVFHGETAEEDSIAVAAYLSSLRDPYGMPKTPGGEKEQGRELFQKLHCASCHVPPSDPAPYFDPEKPMISLKHVAAKFPIGSLKQFLLKPSAHYQSTRMPDFRLTEEEAAHIATWLRSEALEKSFGEVDTTPELISRGKLLVESGGCLSCHTGPGENRMIAADLKTLASSGWNKHCVAPERPQSGMAVHYSLTDDQRSALEAFVTKAASSSMAHTPYESVNRQIENLQCGNCHGVHEGFPSLELMGGKLKPEWAEKFIAGHLDYRMRPWLEARMPAFEFHAKALAQGMAADYGFPIETPDHVAIDADKAEVGRKLVSATDGFACITCHAVNDTPATAVFEAPGTNLGYAGRRLQHEFFTRWVLHPLKVDRSSKMPVYFDKGSSPLTRYYDGDAYRQVEALWHYVLQGDDMAPPVFEQQAEEEEESFD